MTSLLASKSPNDNSGVFSFLNNNKRFSKEILFILITYCIIYYKYSYIWFENSAQ